MNETYTTRDLIRVFGQIGLLSFGGPAAQIALLQRETVERRAWITNETFLRGLSFCMMLPGPEAMQLATYIGWRMRGTLGGLIAGGLFVLPGAFVIAALCALYIAFGDLPLVKSAFLGIQSAVLAIVVAALWRLARKALPSGTHIALALAAFIALFALDAPFPVVVGLAALWGLLRPIVSAPEPVAATPSRAAPLRTIAIWGSLWAAPLVLLGALGGGLLFDLALFFGKLAITTFGGAYAVLAYMTQTIVQTEGWITTGQMVDALGLAETTPGPLILVTQFVGHLAGYGAGGWGLWFAAGIVTLWMTFIPCFLWIFLGAPYVDRLTSMPRIASALGAISAAIVGVMAALSVWFAIHVLFGDHAALMVGPITLLIPDPYTVNFTALACFLLSAIALWVRGWAIPWVLLLCALSAMLIGVIL